MMGKWLDSTGLPFHGEVTAFLLSQVKCVVSALEDLFKGILAAYPADDIRFSCFSGNYFGEDPQCGVSSCLSVRVVGRLEVVDVEYNHRQKAIVPNRSV